MNRYPLWKYLILAVALAFGLLYTLPNFFGEAPAVQVSSAKATIKVDTALMERVEAALKKANITHTGLILDATSVKVRLADIDTQKKPRTS
jgi:preprotein translocase subunit SecD